jgi:hypothetical protein
VQQLSYIPAHEHDVSILPSTVVERKRSDSLHLSVPSSSSAADDIPSSLHSMLSTPPLIRSMVHDPVYIDRWLSAIDEMEQQHSGAHSDLMTIRRHIVDGVQLDLLDDAPPAHVYSNSPSVAQHSDAVRARLAEYMDWGAVVELSAAPDRIQPLLVIIKPGRKPRLCIDLSRNLNDYLNVPPFSYTNVNHAVKLSTPGCWYSKLDLSNCYLSFHLHPSAVPHFAFAFEGKWYTFTRMPFGLSSAPFICTELLSVVAARLRQHGLVLVRYLDDFLLVSPSHAQGSRDLLVAQLVFRYFGLVVNPDKTEGPSQRMSFLGVFIDSVEQTLRVTDDRVLELQQLLSDFRVSTRRTASAQALMSLVGKLSFAAACLPGARPFMRRLLDLVPHGKPRFKLVNLTASFKLDLLYWSTRLPLWNGRCTWIHPQPIVLVSDASMEGFGFHLQSLPPGFDHSSLPKALQPGSGVIGLWSKCHQPLVASHRQIQWAEMFAALAALFVYSPFIGNHSVLLLMDNKSDVGAINRHSSRSKTVCLLVRAMFDLSFRHHFSFRAQHIPGESNVLADFLSRPAKHQHQPLLQWPLQQLELQSQSSSAVDSASLPMLSVVSVLLSSNLMLLELSDNNVLQNSSIPLCQRSNSFPFELVHVEPTRLIMPTISDGVMPLV